MKPIVNNVHIAAQAYKGPAEKAQPRAAAAEGAQAMRAQESAVRLDISREARQAVETNRSAGPRSFKELAALEAAQKAQKAQEARFEPAAPAKEVSRPAVSSSAAEPAARPRLGRLIDITV